jgi:transcriptional regulator GlxA family with amidase domain
MHTVASVVSGRVALFELSVACEVFGIDRSDLADPWYRHVICDAGTEPLVSLQCDQGLSLGTPYGLADLDSADTIILHPWYGDSPPAPELLEALRAAHGRGARLMSLCTGAFVLAATGLLDGRPATTHWMHSAELARLHPRVRVDPRVLYIDDGDILTSAGTAAGIDLCLHVVRLDHGADVANAVARRMVVPPHRDGGQAQFVEAPVPSAGCEDPLAGILGWMLGHLGEALTVEDLAHRAHMSPRTFARQFKAVTGTTPHQWLLSQRVLLAQRLLETTDEPVELVASRCGFGSAAGLRAHFQRAVSASPLAYRRTFRREAG